MKIFRESKGWDYGLPVFNHWCLVLMMAFKLQYYMEYNYLNVKNMLFEKNSM